MNKIQHLSNFSADELIQLNNELSYLLKLDKQAINNNEDLRFIRTSFGAPVDIVEDINEVLSRLDDEKDKDNIFAALVQLVKIQSSPRLSEISHLKEASFYKELIGNGYIEKIRRRIKLPYKF